MMKVNLAEIGGRIRQQRIFLRFTQQDIYEKLNISQNHYSRIENGHTGMSFEILLQLSDILNISTDFILTGQLANPNNVSFIALYNNLNDKQKRYIEKHLDLFAEYDFK